MHRFSLVGAVRAVQSVVARRFAELAHTVFIVERTRIDRFHDDLPPAAGAEVPAVFRRPVCLEILDVPTRPAPPSVMLPVYALIYRAFLAHGLSLQIIRLHIGFGSSHCCRSARARSPAGDAHNTGNSRPAVAVVLPLRVSRSISCGSSDISRSRAAPPPRKHFSLCSCSNPSLHLRYSSGGHFYIRGIDLTSHKTAPHAFGHHACCAAARKWVKYNAALWATR